MVLLAGGYALSVKQARDWVLERKPNYKPSFEGTHEDANRKLAALDVTHIPGIVKNIMKEDGAPKFYCLSTAAPKPSRGSQFVEDDWTILFARKWFNNPKSTIHRYRPAPENDIDRGLKAYLMQQTGLTDEELKWVSVPDPFMQDSHRDVDPRMKAKATRRHRRNVLNNRVIQDLESRA